LRWPPPYNKTGGIAKGSQTLDNCRI
jgi:hypothetical protein